MNKTISYRRVETADEPFLCRVYASTREDELAVTDWNQQQKDNFLQMQFDAQSRHYRQHFARARYEIILIDQQPAGRLYIDEGTDEIRIVDIALLPAFRGRGYGTAIMDTILSRGRTKGVPVRIHVEQFNPAMGLYRRLGFEKIGESGVYFLMEKQPDN